jgi:branched-chain amino acid transport system ATP-binding protein
MGFAVEALEKAFKGFKAVDGVSFSVAPGEMVALIGPNGAGKTTTFNMANGQLAPDRGRVLIDGRDVTGLPPRELWRLGVGRTFQITATFASMTVAENVQVALLSRDRAFGVLAKASGYEEEIHALLSEVGMETAAAQPCGALSYGDLKRVDLAMALANAPQLLLMDEPTAGMARRERAQLMDLVARTALDRRTAVLFTEHDMTVVFGHAHRVLVMCRGKIVAEGTPDDIRANRVVREVYLGQTAPAGR